jgi:hypothetical protein
MLVAGRTSTTGGETAAGGATSAGTGPPPFTGPTVNGTVTVTRATTMGRLAPGFAGFSFEKSHMTDGFFTGTNAPLIAMFKLLGPGVVRIGANDVDKSIWQPSATPVKGGTTTPNVGTADVDALAAFLTATGWKVIYGLNMKASTPAAAVPEAVYVSTKLGASLASFEIGNEISFYSGGVGVIQPLWQTFAVAIQAALPGVALAGPGVYGDINFTSTFTAGEASRAGSADLSLLSGRGEHESAAVPAPGHRPGGRQPITTTGNHRELEQDPGRLPLGGDELVLRSRRRRRERRIRIGALGHRLHVDHRRVRCGGVNFHGGGQNMDGNVCSNGVASCIKPFRYSPIDEVDSQVTAAAPLFYGMLLVSQAGTGSMLATKASAGNLNFTAYSVAPGDGSTNIILVNKDATSGVNATIDVGAAVATASAVFLQAPSLTATTGLTFAGAGVTPAGAWTPQLALRPPRQGERPSPWCCPRRARLSCAQNRSPSVQI